MCIRFKLRSIYLYVRQYIFVCETVYSKETVQSVGLKGISMHYLFCICNKCCTTQHTVTIKTHGVFTALWAKEYAGAYYQLQVSIKSWLSKHEQEQGSHAIYGCQAYAFHGEKNVVLMTGQQVLSLWPYPFVAAQSLATLWHLECFHVKSNIVYA